MKRDMDLIREILLLIEANTNDRISLDLPNYDNHEIGLHIELMIERSLIEGTAIPAGSGGSRTILYWDIIRITWEGYDFLYISRNETIWQKAKKIFLEKTGGLTFDIFKQCLLNLASQAIK